MDYRIERDTMGEVKVPADKYWVLKLREVHRTLK
jgi:fumarate hydratase class II